MENMTNKDIFTLLLNFKLLKFKNGNDRNAKIMMMLKKEKISKCQN